MHINNLPHKLQDNWLVKSVAIYAVVAWVILQVMEVVFPIINLTQFHQRWMLFMIIMGLPVVMIYKWASKGSDTKKQTRRKIIAHTTNIFLVLAGLFSGYSILGSSQSSTISIEDDNGNLQEFTVIKEKYVKQVHIFPFDNATDSAKLDWVGIGLAKAIDFDLDQLNYISSRFSNQKISLAEKQELAKLSGSSHFLTGVFDFQKTEQFTATMKLHSTSNLQEIAALSVNFNSPLEVADTLSLAIREWLKIDPVLIHREADFPVNEALTKSDSAFKYYALGNDFYAVKYDSSFSIAAMSIAWQAFAYQAGTDLLNAYEKIAMKSKDRLPKMRQTQFLVFHYAFKGEKEKAIAVLNKLLRVKSKQIELLEIKLYLMRIWDNEEFLETIHQLETLRELSSSEKMSLVKFLLARERGEEAVAKIEQWMAEDPTNFQHHLNIGIAYFTLKEYDLALDHFYEYQLAAPENKYISQMITAVKFNRNSNHEEVKRRLKSIKGRYQYNGAELRINMLSNDNWMTSGADNQHKDLIFILKNDSTLINYDFNSLGFFEINYHYDSVSNVIGGLLIQTNNPNSENEFTLHNIIWRESLLIDSAKSALQKGDYILAERLFKEAKIQHPDHSFLDFYLTHIDFQTNELFEKEREDFLDVLGEYKVRNDIGKFFQSDGFIYASFFTWDKLRVYPLSRDRFFIDSRSFVELLRTNGEVTGLVQWNLNPITREFERSVPREKIGGSETL